MFLTKDEDRWTFLCTSGLEFSAYYIISDNRVLPALCQQFALVSFLLQHDNALVHKANSTEKWFIQFGEEELDWSAQSSDLNLISSPYG